MTSTRTTSTFACCGAPATPDNLSGHKCNLGRGESAATVRRGARVDSALAAPARHAPSKPAGRAAEDAMAEQLGMAGYLVCPFRLWLWWIERGTMSVCREYPWGITLTPHRKFRSDFAFPQERLLLEVDGRVHHVVARQGRTDVLRAQLAEQAGYRILRVLPEQIATGEALALVRAAIKGGAG